MTPTKMLTATKQTPRLLQSIATYTRPLCALLASLTLIGRTCRTTSRHRWIRLSSQQSTWSRIRRWGQPQAALVTSCQTQTHRLKCQGTMRKLSKISLTTKHRVNSIPLLRKLTHKQINYNKAKKFKNSLDNTNHWLHKFSMITKCNLHT